MNLERVSNEDKLNLCRKYYLGGFALLPFLWLVNVVWFFREGFIKPQFNEQPQIKKYVKWSGAGLLLWVLSSPHGSPFTRLFGPSGELSEIISPSPFPWAFHEEPPQEKVAFRDQPLMGIVLPAHRPQPAP